MINLAMQIMQMGNNPQQIINSLMSQNPQAQALVNQIKNSGMTPQEFVNQFAKQNNIDLNNNPIMNMMKNKGIKF